MESPLPQAIGPLVSATVENSLFSVRVVVVVLARVSPRPVDGSRTRASQTSLDGPRRRVAVVARVARASSLRTAVVRPKVVRALVALAAPRPIALVAALHGARAIVDGATAVGLAPV